MDTEKSEKKVYKLVLTGGECFVFYLFYLSQFFRFFFFLEQIIIHKIDKSLHSPCGYSTAMRFSLFYIFYVDQKYAEKN